ILLFHDFGEILTGDRPYHLKSPEDEAREQDGIATVLGSLPVELASQCRESWLEYHERQSPAAAFAYALDKIEPMFELLDPINERSMKRLKFTFKDHIEKKLVATEGFPVMRRFVDAVTADMLHRDVFWRAAT